MSNITGLVEGVGEDSSQSLSHFNIGRLTYLFNIGGFLFNIGTPPHYRPSAQFVKVLLKSE